MISEKYKALLAKHLAAENAHKLEETLATLTKDCIFDDLALGKVFRGHDGAAQYYRAWWDAFDMTVHTEHRYYPTPHLAVVETRFKGRHIGEFFGLKPTGLQIDIPISIFIGLQDDLMSGERFYWDTATLFRQLGLSVPKLVL